MTFPPVFFKQISQIQLFRHLEKEHRIMSTCFCFQVYSCIWYCLQLRPQLPTWPLFHNWKCISKLIYDTPYREPLGIPQGELIANILSFPLYGKWKVLSLHNWWIYKIRWPDVIRDTYLNVNSYLHKGVTKTTNENGFHNHCITEFKFWHFYNHIEKRRLTKHR